MSLSVICPGCGKYILAKNEYAGKAKCPLCGQHFLIPPEESASHGIWESITAEPGVGNTRRTNNIDWKTCGIALLMLVVGVAGLLGTATLTYHAGFDGQQTNDVEKIVEKRRANGKNGFRKPQAKKAAADGQQAGDAEMILEEPNAVDDDFQKPPAKRATSRRWDWRFGLNDQTDVTGLVTFKYWFGIVALSLLSLGAVAGGFYNLWQETWRNKSEKATS
jgi:hypothetical protein